MVAVEPNIHSEDRQTAAIPKRRFALTRVDRQFLLFALVALLGVRLLAVFWFPFVDTTEARYAEIARKMVETGDWITPQYDYGVPFWGKPPLHTWLSALGMKLFGVTPFGARAFILVAAFSVLGLVFAWVRRHRDADQALVATTVLASSVLFFGASAFVMTDMVMALGTTLSMIGFYNCLNGGLSRVLWGRLFFVGIAIGLLAKGPVALVITMMPIVPWLVLTGRWRSLNALPWASGLLIAALLSLPWYIAAEIKTPGFLRYFIIGEHYERFVVSGWEGDLYGSGHAKPRGIIWLYALGTFLPWTLFALALLPRVKTLIGTVVGEGQEWLSYLALWSVSPLLLFTPAANLLASYVLPGLPAAAVLLVSLWAQVWGAPGPKTRLATSVALVSVAALFGTLAALSYVSPNTLSLKTERQLVAAARRVDADIALTYWGRRSYSADFYTHAKAQFTDQTAAFKTLAGNGVRDAVAIHTRDIAEVAPLLGTGFAHAGQFGRRILFIERVPLGDAS